MIKQAAQVQEPEITRWAWRISNQKEGNATTYTKSLVKQINCVLHITGDQASSAKSWVQESKAEYTSLTQQMIDRQKKTMIAVIHAY